VVLAVAAVLATFVALFASATAIAAPAVTLKKEAPKSVLLGTQSEVHLVAENPKTSVTGYNLTFRDVLPVGVNYVAGSAGEEDAPRVLHDKPAAGETTLIFENVADLSPDSTFTLSYKVEPTATTLTAVENPYVNHAEDFLSELPRRKQKFDENGLPIANAAIGKDAASAATELTAIEINKSEPRPEHEILRGVHEHQVVYTLKVKNNAIKATQGVEYELGKTAIEVDDWLPAGLEFLGCGTEDHTQDNPKSNPGSKEEWPGSGPINQEPPTEAKGCGKFLPYYVGTEEIEPPGQPKGVYTHVIWRGPAELQPGEEFEINYLAGVPIYKNTMTWPGGVEPSPEAEAEPEEGGALRLRQGSNLGNNTGAETKDEEPLINVAEATGVFEGKEVSDSEEEESTAENLAIQKSVTPELIGEGEVSTWTFHIETSEYRFVNEVEIEDTLPNGLCPLGKEDYEGPAGGPVIEPTNECEPTEGLGPTYEIVGSSLGPQLAEYASVAEQEDGTYKIHWDKSKFSELGHMVPSEEMILKFPTRTRTYYQKEFKKLSPVLTGDSWTNTVHTNGNNSARCLEPGENCTAPGAKEVSHLEEKNGEEVIDDSEAGQHTEPVEILKTVRENNFEEVPSECDGPQKEYVKGLISPTETSLPKYRPGDEICWTLRVSFASKLFSGKPVVTDFVPTDEVYVPNSQRPVDPTEGENDLTAEFAAPAPEESGEGQALEWTLGEAVEDKSRVFEYRFKTKMGKTPANGPGEISGNLMKFVYQNTAGQTFPLRDRAEVERIEPELALSKGIMAIEGNPVLGAPLAEAVVGGGEKVTYQLAVKNTGSLDAEEAEVWDVLPEGIECSAITLVEPGNLPAGSAFACEEGEKAVIKWTDVPVPQGGKPTTLEYEMLVPTDVAPGHPFVNQTGVTRYFSETNTTEKFEYIPEHNIDEALNPEANAGELRAEAEVKTTAATLKKEDTTSVGPPGNGAEQATIGEIVHYTVTGTIPPNSKLYGTPVLEDELPAGLKVLASSATLDDEPPKEGLVVEPLPNGAKVNFNGPYPGTVTAEEHTVVLSIEARVENIPGNTAGVELKNEAFFKFADIDGGPATTLEKAKVVPVVEPHLSVVKHLLPNQPTERTNKVAPGEPVEYETEVTNTGSSTAYETTVTDTVPEGMEIVDPGTGAVAGSVITWTAPNILPLETKTFKYTLAVEDKPNAASSYNNVVVAKTQSLPDVEGKEQPETRGPTTPEYIADGYEAHGAKEVKLIGAGMEKSVSAEKATIGEKLTYTLDMNLPANINFFDATVVDTLPNGIEFGELLSAKCVEGCEGTVEGKPLTPVEEGGSKYLGWYFGEFKAGVKRKLEVKFTAFVRAAKRGGGEVKKPELETNHAIGLYDNAAQPEPKTTPIPGAGDGFSESTNEAKAETKVVEPELELEKTVTGNPALGTGTPEIVQPGTTLTYSLKVTNKGTSTAYDSEVTDVVPSANLRNVTPVGEAGLVTSASGSSLTWVIPEIKAGKSVTLTYTAELLPSTEITNGETVENKAAVPHYFGLPEPEREEAKENREYKGPEKAKDLKVEVPQIEVVKTTGAEGDPDLATAEVGVPFKWRVFVKNTAKVATAKAVDVEDVLPANWKYKAGSTTFVAQGAVGLAAAGNPEESQLTTHQVLNWANVAELPAGAAVEVLFEATPSLEAAKEAAKEAAEHGTAPDVVNLAFGSFEDVTGATESGSGPYGGSDTAEAELLMPELTIEKTPDGEPTAAGAPAKYHILVEDIGTGPAHEVEVKDVLGKGQTFEAPAVSTPAFATETVEKDTPVEGETTVVWTYPELAAAAKIEIEVPIKTLPSLSEGTKVSDVASVTSPQAPPPAPNEGSFTIKREADMSIVKTAPANATAGENIPYELHVKNNGPSDATGVEVTDPIPTGTQLARIEGSECAPVTEEEIIKEVSCSLGEMKAGEERVLKFEVEVASATITEVVNTAKVKAEQSDPNHSNDESSVKTTIGTNAELIIHKAGPEHPVLLGNTFQYTLAVENQGPSDATAVKVVDPLPSQVEFVEATTSAGTCDNAPGGVLTCELGTLVAKGPITMITVTVKASEVGNFGNKAKVESPTPEKDPTNNESEAPAEVLPAADLAITKTAPATVEPNGELTYELKVEDLGPSIAHHVVVSDPLPAGVEFVKASEGCTAAGDVVTCEVLPGDELEVGEPASFQVTVLVPFALGGSALTNTASVTAEEGDPHTENNSSTVTTEVGPAADLSITKTMGKAQAGQPLTYTLAITNHGPSESSAVTVKDTLPAGTSFKSAAPSQGTCSDSGQDVICQLGPLAAGASAQVSITVEVAATATGSLRNVATVEGPEPDPDKSNNESSVEGPIAPPVATAPNLRVVKTADTSTPQVGTPFDYHVAITNLSGGEAKNVKVLDTLNGPSKVLSIEAESGHCEANGTKITCTIPSIPVGKTVHVTYSVVAEAAGQLSNTASAQASNGEVAPANNHAMKKVKAKAAEAATFTLTKTAARKVVPGGKKVGFTITLRNGAAALTNAKVCDRLPAALVFVKAAGARYVNGEACWKKPYVAAHKVLRLHLIARAVKGYKSLRARNVATASAANAPQHRTAAATVRIKPAFAGAPGGVTG
jgi:uncharacterized repeat protein (TIGR01451 family)/fimbrial isopeptide formation D2 family protein